jgi:predicted dehydrogenase
MTEMGKLNPPPVDIPPVGGGERKEVEVEVEVEGARGLLEITLDLGQEAKYEEKGGGGEGGQGGEQGGEQGEGGIEKTMELMEMTPHRREAREMLRVVKKETRRR